MAAKQTVILYPSPAIGHLISMVELGKLILKHHPSLSITILIATPPNSTGTTTPYITHVSQTTPLINFHHLPPLPLSQDSSNSNNHENLSFDFLQQINPTVRETLQTMSETRGNTIKALVIDMFCSVALEVGQSLKIPTFFFYTNDISAFAGYLYFPTIFENPDQSFEDPNTQFHVPGLPTLLLSDFPKALSLRNRAYQGFLHSATSMPKSQGIIVNSFESLEPRPLKAIREGLCVPDAPTPPVFCIGPLVAERGGVDDGSKVHECFSWLDSQPSKSVLFLCFGSLGLFPEAQLKEIAIGLENSRQRFLWVVRNPPAIKEREPDFNALLPDGFLDRTKDRGLVLKSWAPQVEVLNHGAIGGFVTHCGWNSVLEAICAGVPMIAWPLYAEQRLNRVFLVKEMKIALPMEEREDGFVDASEVERRVRELMESERGAMVREQTLRMSKDAKVAMNEGGSSLQNLNDFVAELAQVGLN